ncbi:TerC family protein [Carnimonas nigrificans]|uniref:TerC family protein n=1 Tax=Carnimonas nigrificans TaxID=64323 RepID=UPI000470B174|nr:transporter associated domain-containing protein [Carnimonas nigrificans]
MLEIFLDPTAWAGLVTLIVLELVLGIDNLVFIAILADKVHPSQRDRARIIGLALALFMRMALLASMSWLMSLTDPLFTVGDLAISLRDLILCAGGLFLMYKATSELHEHISPATHHASSDNQTFSPLAMVVAQIVVLDAVFSIDSVITAVGMVQQLEIMMVAVVIAVCIMMWASKPLTVFVSNHPTIVILCLSFLLMIGLSLVCEAVHIEIPKGYLYGAIVFSLLVELLQELRRRGTRADAPYSSRRARTTAAIMRMIGGNNLSVQASSNDGQAHSIPTEELFGASERRMVEGVLSLADKPIEAIITLRRDIETIDLHDPIAKQLSAIAKSQHSWLVVIEDGHSDEPLGVINTKRLLDPLIAAHPPADLRSWIEQPLVLLENVSVINALEHFRNSGNSIAFVVDEFGTLTGIATTNDILEEIAGKLPNKGEEEAPVVTQVNEQSFDVDASEDIHDINKELPHPLPIGRDYTTLAGLVLYCLETLPYIGAATSIDGWDIRVLDVERHRIKRVRLTLSEVGNGKPRI